MQQENEGVRKGEWEGGKEDEKNCSQSRKLPRQIESVVAPHTHTHTCPTQVLREAGEEGREAGIRGQFGIASGSCHVLNVQN